MKLSGKRGAPGFCDSQRRDQRPAEARVGRLPGVSLDWDLRRGSIMAAELVEAVGGGQAGGGELPEGVLGLLFGEGGDALEVVGEAGSTLGEQGCGFGGLRGRGSGRGWRGRRIGIRGRGGASRRTRGCRR